MAAGPEEISRLLEGMKVEVAHRFAAPIESVWALLTDVERMAGLGPEHTAASWVGEGRGLGARFDGANKNGDMEWTLPCFVTEWEPPHRFGWAVLEQDDPSSVWTYALNEVEDGTEVVQRFTHGPNFSFTRMWAQEQPDQAEAIIERRMKTLESDMRTTLANAGRLLLRAP